MSAAALAVAAVVETASSRSPAAAALHRVGRSLLVVVSALVLLTLLWAALLELLDVSTFVGKTPVDVFHYLVTEVPARGVRPTSLTAEQARGDLLAAWTVTLADAGMGFLAGLLVAVIAAIVVLFPALVTIVLGLRSASPLALDLIAVNGGGPVRALLLVRLPAALPAIFASVRISVPGAIVGAMLAEWLTGFIGLGGIVSAYKGRGNFGGVWAIVVVSVATSIVGYAVAAVAEAAALSAWGPEAGKR